MNTLTVTVFACVVVFANAVPSGIYGLGYAHGHDHLPLVGASGVVSSHGAAGPAGVVNGHGAVGPNGIPNAVHGHAGVLIGASNGLGLSVAHGQDDGQWHGEGLLDSQDWAGHGSAASVQSLNLGYSQGHNDGQWRGEGLLASQDWAGHGPSGAIVAHGVYGNLGLSYNSW